MSNKDAFTLFNLQETRITADPTGLWAFVSMFTLGAVISPGVSLLARLRRGLFTTIAYVICDITHYGGHIYSSRVANAPVDQVHFGAPMPMTIYNNNDVSPEAHKLRAIGGPIASLLMLLILLFLRAFTAPNTMLREFFNIQSWVHGILGFGSLAPIPFVDGGSILKWTMVQRGQTPEQADESVKEANLVLGGFIGFVGLVGALLKKWKLAAGCLFVAAQFIAIGLGKLNTK